MDSRCRLCIIVWCRNCVVCIVGEGQLGMNRSSNVVGSAVILCPTLVCFEHLVIAYTALTLPFPPPLLPLLRPLLHPSWSIR